MADMQFEILSAIQFSVACCRLLSSLAQIFRTDALQLRQPSLNALQTCKHSPGNVQDLQVNSGPKFAHRGSSQQAPTSPRGAAPTEIHDGTSGRGTPDVGSKDTAGGEASGPEGSMCPPSSPSWATTIPDGCDDGAAVGDDQVDISWLQPSGIVILQRCIADSLSPQAVSSLRRRL